MRTHWLVIKYRHKNYSFTSLFFAQKLTLFSCMKISWFFIYSTMARETGVHSHVESYQRLKKWYLIPLCLTLSIIRFESRVKWSQPGKGEAPLRLSVVVNEKGAFLSPSTSIVNFIYVYIYIYISKLLIYIWNIIIKIIYIYIYTHTHIFKFHTHTHTHIYISRQTKVRKQIGILYLYYLLIDFSQLVLTLCHCQTTSFYSKKVVLKSSLKCF